MNEEETTVVDTEIRDFVAGVRSHLDDLRCDEIDELTTGLEADLAEIREDAGTIEARLGTPRAYAAELRAAAGLPPRRELTPVTRPLSLVDRWITRQHERLTVEARRRYRDSEIVRTSVDYLVTLRPAWWVARGVALSWLVVTNLVVTIPQAAGFLITIALVVASVWWGLRSRQRISSVGRRTRTVANGLIGVIAIGVIGSMVYRMTPTGDSSSPVAYARPAQGGLQQGGTTLSNVFVYDADGKPVPRARLFGDLGQPLTVTNRGDGRLIWSTIYGETATNVFPVASTGIDPWKPMREDRDHGRSSWTPPELMPPLAATPSAPPTSSSTGKPTVTPTGTLPTAGPTPPPGQTTPTTGPTSPDAPTTPPTGKESLPPRPTP